MNATKTLFEQYSAIPDDGAFLTITDEGAPIVYINDRAMFELLRLPDGAHARREDGSRVLRLCLYTDASFLVRVAEFAHLIEGDKPAPQEMS